MRLPKFFKYFAASGVLFFATVTGAWAEDIRVQLDGRILQFDQPAARIAGRLMAPLRGIFEALEADVVYDPATRAIQATKGSRVIQLQMGSREALVDGRTVILDTPADTIEGRTMVPLRFVAEALGAEVKWDAATKTVKLSSTGEQGSVAQTPPPPPNSENANAQPPRIDRVFHSATRELKSGDTVDVVIYGVEKGKATFEILGSTNLISVPEVSPGKYQTRWRVPQGLVVEKGILLAHLRLNGRETAVEAQRQITVVAGSSKPGTAQTDNWALSPASGSTTANSRPRLSLTFPAPIQPQSLRLYVDGVDFSNQVRLSGRQISWQPTYNLSSARHAAEVRATTTSGQQLSRSWGFVIDPNYRPDQQQGQTFRFSELRPKRGAKTGARPEIGAILSEEVSYLEMYVDGRPLGNQSGVRRASNALLWTPKNNLSPGTHRVKMMARNRKGATINTQWNFEVSNLAISNFTFSPLRASSSQQVKVRLQGPAGAKGIFSVGQVNNLALREVTQGQYEGLYTVSSRDKGNAKVSAQLRLQNGQVLRATAPKNLEFIDSGQLTVSNLSNGMAISPVFNVQGTGRAGQTVTVLVEYGSGDILGALSGQTRRLQTQGQVRANGSYDIQVDASVVRHGQKIRLSVSDGQSQAIQLVLTRR